MTAGVRGEGRETEDQGRDDPTVSSDLFPLALRHFQHFQSLPE